MKLGCDICRHFSCVCTINRRHAADCRFRRAATSAIEIACEPHGRGVCPTCDACTCGATVTVADLGSRALVDRWTSKEAGQR